VVGLGELGKARDRQRALEQRVGRVDVQMHKSRSGGRLDGFGHGGHGRLSMERARIPHPDSEQAPGLLSTAARADGAHAAQLAHMLRTCSRPTASPALPDRVPSPATPSDRKLEAQEHAEPS
jgi:hypothetical protein